MARFSWAPKIPPRWDLRILFDDFFEDHTFLGRAVLSKTVNCSSVNLVDAVLSDLANTLDWILNIGMDFERLDTFGTPQVLSYGNLPWHLLSCVLTRPGWWSWGTRLNRGDKKSLCLRHARAWGALFWTDGWSWSHYDVPRHWVGQRRWSALKIKA